MFLIWIVLIIAVIVLFYDKLGFSKKEDPLTILKQRLARGEISIDEFEKAKHELLK
jgi:uncharacterized membrane protein